ncbi:Tetratricopeptide repeat protein [uncultured archaeon]|nr:Tetratricopeptide repeat protein [uncultured archaeon]
MEKSLLLVLVALAALLLLSGCTQEAQQLREALKAGPNTSATGHGAAGAYGAGAGSRYNGSGYYGASADGAYSNSPGAANRTDTMDRVAAKNYNDYALQLDAQGQYVQAIHYLNKSIEATPDCAICYLNRGHVYTKMDDYAHASADLEQAIAMDPELMQAYQARSELRNLTGDKAGAMEDAQKAVQLQVQALEQQGEVYDQICGRETDAGARSQCYNMAGRQAYTYGQPMGMAIRYFSMAIEANHSNAYAYSNRCLARRDAGDLTQARADCEQAVALNASMDVAYDNLGTIKMRMGDMGGALADLNTAVRLDGENCRSYYNRAVAETELAQFRAARADYDQALKYYPQEQVYNPSSDPRYQLLDLYPQEWLIRYNRASVLDNLQERAAAIADLDRVVEIDPHMADAYVMRAIVKAEYAGELQTTAEVRAEIRSAEADLDKAESIEPSNSKINAARTMVQKRLNDILQNRGSSDAG